MRKTEVNKLDIQELELIIEQVGYQHLFKSVPVAIRNNLSISIEETGVGGILRAFSKIPYSLEKTLTFRTPKTWWDHFKERFFPEWLKDRFPVEYDVTGVEARAYYPTYDKIIPDHKPVMRLKVLRDANLPV